MCQCTRVAHLGWAEGTAYERRIVVELGAPLHADGGDFEYALPVSRAWRRVHLDIYHYHDWKCIVWERSEGRDCLPRTGTVGAQRRHIRAGRLRALVGFYRGQTIGLCVC